MYFTARPTLTAAARSIGVVGSGTTLAHTVAGDINRSAAIIFSVFIAILSPLVGLIRGKQYPYRPNNNNELQTLDL